ncbi:MAG TPA: phenylalanine--tRNA ligase subunit beta [Tepidisphaeraceae bacterium]|jgi:phenylalanyl-tRNA synthetase beta chain|nr:phenylalanine--tRNA ligase subunit beta [Tepidisphaeraceae bacterium]
MNISLEWLAEYLPGPLDLHAAADTLTNSGFVTEHFSQVGPDQIMDVEVTSNRGDCLSHLGIARELAALLKRPFKDVTPSIHESGSPTSSAISLSIDAKDLCPHYTARIIRNVKVAPSPAWLQRRLTAVGLRPINNIVDITNYVLFELGQPLHAFDYDKLAGKQIIVRTAKPGEKLTSLDGHERSLTPGMLVIADSSKPVALAGVMGGKETEVSGQTTTILLESARFEPLSIRKTARALAMKSDSSYRFERGIDPALPARASQRAAELILQLAGGELAPGLVESGTGAAPQKKLSLRSEKIRRTLGIDIPVPEIADALTRLQFPVTPHSDRVDVTVPSHRLDINIEVDLVEEVARVLGYDRIPTRDEISIRLTPPDPRAKTTEILRSTLVGSGYYEAVTFSWAVDSLATDFLPTQANTLPRADQSVRKADAQLRPSLLPGLLEAVRRNEAAGTPSAKLFEIGSTFFTSASSQIVEQRKLAFVGSPDLHELRGVVESLLTKLNPSKKIQILPDLSPGYSPTASARIEWDGQAIGHLGQISKEVAAKLDLRSLPCAAELDESALLTGVATVVTLKPLPKFPAVRRDLSLVVAEPTRYEQLDTLIQSLSLQNLEDIEYVTTYRGKPLAKGQKSVTLQLVFRSPDATLTSESVETAVQRVITESQSKLNATLRT